LTHGGCACSILESITKTSSGAAFYGLLLPKEDPDSPVKLLGMTLNDTILVLKDANFLEIKLQK
jgi:hypothetical protein